MLSLMLAETMPQLGIYEPKCEKLTDWEFEFSCAVKNTGFLPTSSSQQAQTVRAVKPVKVRLTLSAGVTLLAGKAYEELPSGQVP